MMYHPKEPCIHYDRHWIDSSTDTPFKKVLSYNLILNRKSQGTMTLSDLTGPRPVMVRAGP